MKLDVNDEFIISHQPERYKHNVGRVLAVFAAGYYEVIYEGTNEIRHADDDFIEARYPDE